jgi:hypothetical protein
MHTIGMETIIYKLNTTPAPTPAAPPTTASCIHHIQNIRQIHIQQFGLSEMIKDMICTVPWVICKFEYEVQTNNLGHNSRSETFLD